MIDIVINYHFSTSNYLLIFYCLFIYFNHRVLRLDMPYVVLYHNPGTEISGICGSALCLDTPFLLIKNAEICRLVFITPWGNDEAEMWFWKQMDQKWYINLLEEFWARKWDVLKIKSYYYGQDDKYIMY